MKFTRILSSLLAVAASALLVSCSDGSSNSAAGSSDTTIVGSAVKGPVNGATVTIKRADTGETLGTTTTKEDGSYTIKISYKGDVVVEVSGGTYTDEATGASTSLSSPMRTVIAAAGGDISGQVTPLTTMAYTIAQGSGSISSSGFSSAALTLGNQFGLSGVSITSTLPSVTGTSLNDYGRALRALSQYMQTNSQSWSSFATGFTATTAYFSTLQTGYRSAYSTANPGKTVTVSLDASGFTVSGTGLGGQGGQCAVTMNGTVSLTSPPTTVPVNTKICMTGLGTAACDSGNPRVASLANSVASPVSGTGVTYNLTYTYGTDCSGSTINVTYTP